MEGKLSHPHELTDADRFKQKYPGQGAPKNSAFLKKRLQGGSKYFDSGDYYSAKSSEGKEPSLVIGKAFPTVDKLPQARKQSSSKLSGLVDGVQNVQNTNDEKCEMTETEEQKSKLHIVE